MSDATLQMTRYFLGELTEPERDELEARCFDDARVFDQLTAVETALVDDYVRGRLEPDVLRRFEAHYLAHPSRRERVRFAETLLATVDRQQGSSPLPLERRSEPSHGTSGTWLAWMPGPRFALTLATAILAVAVAVFVITDSRRSQLETGSTADERPVPDSRGATPSPEAATPSPPDTATSPPQDAPGSPTRPLIAVVTVALTVGPGERTTAPGTVPAFVVPPGTNQIRFVLTLREHDYARYRVIVRAVGGGELMRRGRLVPTAGSPPTIAIVVPAAGFDSGDYMLTLQGATDAGEFEDLSQTLFRVNREGAPDR